MSYTYGFDETSIYSVTKDNNTQPVHNTPHFSQLDEYPKPMLGLPVPYMEQIVITPSNDLPTVGELNHLYNQLEENKRQYYQIGNAYETGSYCYNNPNCLSTTPLSIVDGAAQNSIYKMIPQTTSPPKFESADTFGRRRRPEGTSKRTTTKKTK